MEMTGGVATRSTSDIYRDCVCRNTSLGGAVRPALLRMGGAAALVAGMLFRRNMDAELLMLRATGVLPGGPLSAPTDVAGWFGLFQSERLTALVLLGFFDIVNYLLVALIFVAACAALWRASRRLSTLAAVLTPAGVSFYLASNRAFAMLALSEQYASAATGVQRSALLAAGQALLAIHSHATYGDSIYPGFLLISAAGLALALAMLHGRIFSQRVAWTGIVANVLGLSYYLTRSLAPALVALPLSLSAIFLLAWYILVGLRLLQLGRA